MEMKPLREQQAEAWFQVADALDSVQPGWLEAFSEKSGGECAVECIQSMHARITELESRLEIDERHPIDGIAARDATIKYQDQRIAELEKDSARLNWMQENYLCADFRYGDPATEVLVIEIPRCTRVCGDLRVDVDTAMQKD